MREWRGHCEGADEGEDSGRGRVRPTLTGHGPEEHSRADREVGLSPSRHGAELNFSATFAARSRCATGILSVTGVSTFLTALPRSGTQIPKPLPRERLCDIQLTASGHHNFPDGEFAGVRGHTPAFGLFALKWRVGRDGDFPVRILKSAGTIWARITCKAACMQIGRTREIAGNADKQSIAESHAKTRGSRGKRIKDYPFPHDSETRRRR